MISSLPERFLAPSGWHTHSFTNPETGHKIHYGYAFPQGEKPANAIIVCLPGLSEFGEKYYEFAHDMLDRGYAFAVIDWQYQGRSGRHAKCPQRRHSDGFDSDISDLLEFVTDYIKPSSMHPDRGAIPLVMAGHSMGGHIGLRFLAEHPGIFSAAAFSAPFLGIYNFNYGMRALAELVRPLMPFIGDHYAFGGKDWNEAAREGLFAPIFSSDKMRSKLHNAWAKQYPELQIGSVTFGWVMQALHSCDILAKTETAEKINIPVFIAAAGNDQIVDNDATRKIVHHLPNARFLEIAGSAHEILMEQDTYRNQFLNGFDNLLKENNIIERKKES
jgi:lysophospholipase